MKRNRIFTVVIAVICFASIAFGQGMGQGRGTRTYTVQLQPMNDSGVMGTATLTVIDREFLRVTILAGGLEPGQLHPQHIHGFMPPTNSKCPPPSADDDGDGLVELLEGLPFYGPILLSLTPFPVADADGTIFFQQTYRLGENGVPTFEELHPLQNRAIVLHGMTVNGTYWATLPVACGPIEVSPMNRR